MTTIRKATVNDAASIVTIYNWYITHSTSTFDTDPVSVENAEHWLTSQTGDTPFFVAETDSAVSGWARIKRWSDRGAYRGAAEVSIFVEENLRGRGIGPALGRHLIEQARPVGYHTLIARIGEGNETSMRMFAQLGFEPAGFLREVGEKFGQRLGNHIYQRML